ncbi:MAG: sporulation protein YunB [Clostridia bacterium]|nr:sporulation protein YunB [Clostridia bacterium]
MRRRRTNRVLRGGAFLLVAVLLVCGVGMVDSRLRPLIQNYGYMAARRGAMLAVHTGVETVLADEAVNYSSLVTVYRSEMGQVLSAEANVTAINRLKSHITNAVMQELSKREEQTVKLPLGSLIGGSFFTGRGPFLSVKIHTSGAVISNLTGTFTDAGINQTNHRVLLDMTVMVTAALPTERVSLELSTQFLICETVLVGEVPETITQMDLGGEWSNIFGAND